MAWAKQYIKIQEVEKKENKDKILLILFLIW